MLFGLYLDFGSFLPLEQRVERRQYQQRQQRVRENAADNDCCQRALHFAAHANVDRHWNEAQRCHERGHQDWAQANQAAFAHRFFEWHAGFELLLDERDQHQAVEDSR